MTQTAKEFVDSLKFGPSDLIPAVVQDASDKTVLMVAYMNAESLEKTMNTGKATYFSRSRNTLWVKGETSGHLQYVKRILFDCDRDTILLQVEQIGPACHENYRSCFYREARILDDSTMEEIIVDTKETES